MRKWKTLIAVCTAFTMAVSFTACSSQSQDSSQAEDSSDETGSGSDSETYVLKLATSMSKEEAIGQQMETLAEKVEDYTDGRVTVERYYNGELGSSNDVTEMAQQGANIFSFETMDFYSSYAYDLGILDGPFFFYEPEEMRTLEESDWWQEQMDVLAQSNLYCLGTIYFGSRDVIHKEGDQAASPADFKGVCMRTANTPMRYAMCEALTGNVTTVAWSEIYSALNTGVADMCEAPLSSIVGTKIYEVCPYITMDEHIHAFIGVSASKSWFDTLPEDIQENIQKAVDEVCADSIEFVKDDEVKQREFLESEGVTFVEVEDKEAWAEATKSAYDKMEFTEGTYEKCMEILNH